MKTGRGFSLIELLMVLGVMAILMGMLAPAVGVIRQKAQRMATAQKMRQIGLAVATYRSLTGRSLVAADLGDWMARLASETGVRDGELYIFNEDPLLSLQTKSVPPVLVVPGDNGKWEEIDGFENWPIGVTVVSGLAMDANPSTTPIAWTRGLGTDGQWQHLSSSRPGVYGSEGGFIVFLDGRVEFFRNLGEDGGRLVHFEDGTRTSDIRDAVSPGARAFDFLGQVF